MKKNLICGLSLILTLCSCDIFSNYKFYDEENYSVLSITEEAPYIEAFNVSKINVDWLQGVVHINSSSEVSSIRFYEEFYDYKPSKNELSRYEIENNTLDIKYAKSKATFVDNLDKDLYITIPTTLKLNEIYVNSMSASVEIENVLATKIKIAEVSGNCKIQSKVETLEIQSVSGNNDIYFNCEDNFSVNYSTIGGKFSSDFECESSENGCTYFGNPLSSFCCFIQCETSSGNLSIKKS